jgi:hypothetical protein
LAKVKLQAGKEAVERANEFSDFEQIRPCTCRMVIKEITSKFAKGDDGKPDKSRPMLEFVLKPYSEDREGKKRFQTNYGQLWTYLRTTGDGQESSRAMWALALGATPNARGNVELTVDTTKDVGKHVIVRVKSGENLEGEYRPEVANVWPVTAGSEVVGDDDTDEELEDEVEDEELDEEDSDNPFGDDEEDADDGEYLTEEGLMAMEMKDLGEVAKEFDIDPKANIVRNRAKKFDEPRTRKKLVKLILDAQGANSDDEEVEEPF